MTGDVSVCPHCGALHQSDLPGEGMDGASPSLVELVAERDALRARAEAAEERFWKEAADLIAERDALRERNLFWQTEAGTWQAKLDALRAANAEMREALKPFAAFANRFGETARDDSWVLTRNPSGKGDLTMGDVRRAREAIRKALKEPAKP